MKRQVKYDDMRRGDVLRWLKKRKMSQAEWARKLGYGFQTVFYWIHRGGDPREPYLKRIERVTPDCPMVAGRR